MQASRCSVERELEPETAGGGSIDGGPAKFRPGAVRYIKLGPGGQWARQAIAEGTLAESGATRTAIPAQGGQQSGDCGQQVMAG